MRLTSFLIAVFAPLADAQLPAAAPCSAPEHRQFDFWIGEWEVTLATGQRAGTNRIERILGGCALQESWTGASPSQGQSLTVWDPGDHTWHQTWVDNAGTTLHLSGGIVNGEMVLEGQRRLPDGTEVTDRITWTPNADGTLRQVWQSSQDRGMRWTTVFDGVYRRRIR
jgi:hypothetical protein